MVNPVGVLLPNGVPGCRGETIVTWARVADDGPFTSLGTADRYVYVNHEPMMTMAAVAATTARIRLLTAALIPALRPAPLFAKQVATLTQLAPGRVTLGIAVGNRRNDYDEAALDFTTRGRVLDENLAYLDRLRDLRSEENVVGPQLGSIEILIGGASRAATRRLLSHGDGLVSGGLKPEVFAFEAFATVEAWKAAGKPGRPRLVASTWYASSTDPDDLAAARLASYLKNGGPPPHVISGIARGSEGVEQAVAAFRAQGADEVVFFPLLDDVAELEWLADQVAAMPDHARGVPAPDFTLFVGDGPSMTGNHG
ncbi:LLM class flavin-dependent oxidoreductase [Micromonospora marina]|uniref:LLM class flavin-dependent oxidoreductase n=1 Tax=Micromonospora marina TaxID=307120 RepID=UPI00345526C4